MKRFLLLLLAFVLPLQMSWAASHLCNDDGMVAAVPQVESLSGHHGTTADQPEAGTGSADLSDPCCTAAHGCHGLHHIAGNTFLKATASLMSQMPAATVSAPHAAQPAARLERPKWLTA